MSLESHPPDKVLVSTAELAQMRADQQKIQELATAREVEASAATLRAAAVSGQFEQMARSHRQEIEQERNRAAAIAAKAELASALAQQPLVPAAAGQLASILSSEIISTPDGRGGYQVLSKDYRSVGEFVQSKLADPAYAHFRADQKPAPPVNRPNQPSTELPAEPRTLSEALIATHQHFQAAHQSAGEQKSPLLDPSQGFGGFGRKGPSWGGLPGFGRPR
jgi:hypothetical protein